MPSWLPAPGNVEFADYGSKVSREADASSNDLTTCYGHFVSIPRLWLSADYRCPARNPGLTNEHPEQKRIRDAQASNATKDPLMEHHRARQACAPTTDPALAGKSMAISYILEGRVPAEAVRVTLV